MNTAEKLRLGRQLEKLGVDILEAGFPIASPGEVDAVKAVADEIRSVKVAALCRAKEADIKAAGNALRSAAHPVIHCFLATSAIHLKYKLKITAEEALKQAVDGIRLARTFAKEVEFSAEDASRTDYGYLRDLLTAVYEAGATTLNVPDTVGYCLPAGLRGDGRAISSATSRAPSSPSTATTTSGWPWPTRSPPCRRARGRSSARSTASASGRATPRSRSS